MAYTIYQAMTVSLHICNPYSFVCFLFFLHNASTLLIRCSCFNADSTQTEAGSVVWDTLSFSSATSMLFSTLLIGEGWISYPRVFQVFNWGSHLIGIFHLFLNDHKLNILKLVSPSQFFLTKMWWNSKN